MAVEGFREFMASHERYRKYEGSNGAAKVYEFLKKEENIEKMIKANNEGKPALYGVQSYLETNFVGMKDFDLSEGYVRTCIGTMVKDVLAPLGYSTNVEKRLPEEESLYFKSAMTYCLEKR